ncbi:hypothetical protein [Mycobacterium sp.]|uniref:hypothetical protein n=1 Tax=Mycobacterium sp. TaxID=1785 RepID=UPI003C746E5C
MQLYRLRHVPLPVDREVAVALSHQQPPPTFTSAARRLGVDADWLRARSGVTWIYGWSAAEISCSDKWRRSCSPTPSGRLYASFRNSMPYFRNCWRSRASLGNMA